MRVKRCCPIIITHLCHWCSWKSDLICVFGAISLPGKEASNRSWYNGRAKRFERDVCSFGWRPGRNIGLSRKNQGSNNSSIHFFYTFHVFYTLTTRLVILLVFRLLFLKRPSHEQDVPPVWFITTFACTRLKALENTIKLNESIF